MVSSRPRRKQIRKTIPDRPFTVEQVMSQFTPLCTSGQNAWSSLEKAVGISNGCHLASVHYRDTDIRLLGRRVNMQCGSMSAVPSMAAAQLGARLVSDGKEGTLRRSMPATGRDPIIKLYTHISDRYAPFHVKVITGTSGEAIHVLDGLVNHDSAIDILGRSTRDVLNLVHELEAKGAALTVLEPAFSTKDATGSILVTVLGMVAEMERRFIRERQQAGIEAAKKRGVYRGRKAPRLEAGRGLAQVLWFRGGEVGHVG
jgi:Resolvase, N terminal domain/Tn3 transposase DDE domain